MKLCDFTYYYKGYHFETLSVESNLYGVLMAMFLPRSAWLKLSGFCEKWSVFHSKVIDIGLTFR